MLNLDELRALCQEYDARAGVYPEHEYEGQAVFAWIKAKLEGSPDHWERNPGGPHDPAGSDEWDQAVHRIAEEIGWA